MLLHTRWPVVAQGLGAVLMLLVAVWPWPTKVADWNFKHALVHSGLDVRVLILGTTLAIWGSVLRGSGGAIWFEPIRWFGRHSYEIYLTHEFAVIAVLTLLRHGPVLIWVAAVLALSAALGWFFARFFSEPMNRALRGSSPSAGTLLSEPAQCA